MHDGRRTGLRFSRGISILSIVPMALILAIAAPGAAATDVEPTCGDVNGSGAVTTADALALLRESVGQPVELQCPAPGALARTAQGDCWDNVGNLISCNGTGQDGELRVGLALSYTDNGDGTITDNVTGLMWEKLSRNGTIHDVGNKYEWLDAFARVATLNDNQFAGHTDWRLPDQRELFSLVTFGGAADQTISGVFRTDCQAGCPVTTCSCTAAESYWSSTSNPFSPTSAEGVSFETAATISVSKNSNQHARAVRTAD